MPAVRRSRHATGLWVIVIAVGFAVVGGCDSSGDQPPVAGPGEVTTKAAQNQADFMKTQPKSKSARK